MILDGHAFRVIAERDPAKLPWKELKVDVVIESTGLFTAREKAALHLSAGARKVVISAPADGVDVTLCWASISRPTIRPTRRHLQRFLHHQLPRAGGQGAARKFGIVHGLMTTVHAYTSDQMLQDGPHDLRRAARRRALDGADVDGGGQGDRTGAAELKGKLDGIAIRVPVADVSVVDLTAVVERDAEESRSTRR